LGLTQTAALEYAARGIRINAVCPGTIKTPMVQSMTGGDAKALAEMVKDEPIGRLGEPEEIAAAVLWLCSPGASFVVGHALLVDGRIYRSLRQKKDEEIKPCEARFSMVLATCVSRNAPPRRSSSRRMPSFGWRSPASAGRTCGTTAASTRSPSRSRWGTSTAASSRRSDAR